MITTELINEITIATFPTTQVLLEFAFDLLLVGIGIRICKAAYYKLKDLFNMLYI